MVVALAVKVAVAVDVVADGVSGEGAEGGGTVVVLAALMAERAVLVAVS